MDHAVMGKDVEVMAQEALAVADLYSACVVVTAEDYVESGNRVVKLRGMQRALSEKRLSLTRPLDAAKNGIMDFFAKPAIALENAERREVEAMKDYNRRVAEVQRQESLRLQHEAEDARIAEAQRLAAESAKALESGQAAEAQRLAQRVGETVAAPVAPVYAPPIAPPKVSGMALRKLWRHRVVDAALLPREYMIPNDTMLAALAVSMKEKASVPGVEFYAKESM